MLICHLTHFLDAPIVYFHTLYVLNPTRYFHYYRNRRSLCQEPLGSPLHTEIH